MAMMSSRFEGSFRTSNQTEIFYQLWPVPAARGTMVMTHGLAEHSDCYHPFAKTLQAEGWEVYGWDLPGHGRSSGKRGYVGNFREYTDSLKQFTELIGRERENKSIPLVLFGHSLGGLVTTLTMLDWASSPVSALVLSSPAFGIAVPVPAIKDHAARLAFRWLPSLTLHNEIKYTDLTRDEKMVRSYEQDVLRHDKISPAVYLGLIEGAEQVEKRATTLNLPILLQLAGVDRIVSTRAAQDVFAKLPDKRNVMQIYPESYHEIYNDLDREQAFSDLRKFLSRFQVTT